MAGSLKERSSGDEMEENHEINVTPFIDVMLVLLIIFMVAAPLSTVDVPVDLPGSNAQPTPRANDPVYLTVQQDLTLSLGEEPVAREALGPALGVATKGDAQTRIYLRADQAVEYGALMEVMNLLRNAGYLKIALVGTEMLPGAAAAAPAGEAAPGGAPPAPAAAPEPAQP